MLRWNFAIHKFMENAERTNRKLVHFLANKYVAIVLIATTIQERSTNRTVNKCMSKHLHAHRSNEVEHSKPKCGELIECINKLTYSSDLINASVYRPKEMPLIPAIDIGMMSHPLFSPCHTHANCKLKFSNTEFAVNLLICERAAFVYLSIN